MDRKTIMQFLKCIVSIHTYKNNEVLIYMQNIVYNWNIILIGKSNSYTLF